jgi:Clostripain family
MAAKWTLMVYMAGFNNLSEFATKDLAEMRRIGSTDDVKVVVFIKRLGQRSVHHIVVEKDGKGEEREQVGRVDSGNPQTMLDFVRWATERAAAERYGLVVWNHGSGFAPDDLQQLYSEVRVDRGDTGVTPRELSLRSNQQIARSLFSTTVEEVLALESVEDRAIASDDGTGHSLDTIELNRVVKRAHEKVLDGPLELLGMDACLMSNLEVSYECEPHVAAVVGSEELEPGDGWPYSQILKDLTENADMSGAELGQAVVNRYVESYRNRRNQWPVTQCAVNSSGIDGFVDALDELGRELRSHIAKDGAGRVQRAQMRSTYFMGELVDVRTLCRELRAAIPTGKVNQAAGKVVEALKPNGYVVDEGHLGPTVEGCGGVTVYFPYPAYGSEGGVSPYYKDLRFAKRGWDDFLRSYMRALRGD